MRTKAKKRAKRYTIAILYHLLTKADQKTYPDVEHVLVDEDTGSTVQFIQKLLTKHKFKVQVLPLSINALDNLKKIKADYIFNLVDSRALEVRIAKILDRLSIPHSGPPVWSILASNNKLHTKKLLQKSFLPIPKFTVIHRSDRLRKSLLPSKYPVIVKPAYEHCSIGITSASVAQRYEQFKRIVTNLRKKYHQTLIVEEFIPGEELQVTVYENGGKTVALPPAQITWKGDERNKWNIYGFDEKWDKTSLLWKNSQFIAPPKRIPADDLVEMKKQSIRAFYAMQFRDYARFDLRYNTKERRWYFLEGNANAGISPGAGDAMTASVRAAGMTLDDFVLQIVKNSLH
ncbi:ATP-grasp domain-containing protein [Candidatus Gottesmanbacteria bacterium]|nr:ATP-grasp domain-containing protein [Candidatus Gottesmanbacteria bacterium]